VYVALLDAACLVPVVITDTLLRLAEQGLFRPIWSEKIIDEARQALTIVHPELPDVAIARRLRAMNDSFEDAVVPTDAWLPLVEGLELPDPDDTHVVAAAIAGRAECIVTPNLKDFPDKLLASHGIRAVSPDTFLLDQLDIWPARVIRVLHEQAAGTGRPPLSFYEILGRLSRAGTRSFADEVLRRIDD